MKGTALLRRKILSRDAQIVVIGQGYVGLSLACANAEAGFQVVGLDIDPARVSDLNEGVLSVAGVSNEVFESARNTENLRFSTKYEDAADADCIFICVPTPVRDNGPDLSYITSACQEVARYLKQGQLVVLESTTFPGTTEGPVRDILEESGLIAGRDFLLAYSPERIDPGNQEFDFRSVPRVVGGVTPEATGMAALFYGQFVDKVLEVSSCRAAELAKLLENTFRHVNIALVNEMAMICHETQIDVWEVLGAAASKPFGFMPFSPGPGVGGHCIPLDPTYWAWQVRRDAGHPFRLLEQAQDINDQMPVYTASRIADTLNNHGKAVRNSKILMLGVAYKPDVGDIRESPALKIMNILMRRGAVIQFHDPFVEELKIGTTELTRTPLTKRGVATADCVALITPHQNYDLDWIAEHANLIFDARDGFGPRRLANVERL